MKPTAAFLSHSVFLPTRPSSALCLPHSLERSQQLPIKSLPSRQVRFRATLADQAGPASVPTKERETLPELSIDTSLYQNTTVVLTGSTGYVGSTILTTLLDKTNAEFILLVRSKEGSSAEGRVRKFLENGEAFKHLTTSRSDIEKRIKVVSSDLEKADLSLDVNAWNDAIDWVTTRKRNISLIHCSASIKFDDPLEKMFPINVLAVIGLINLIEQCSIEVKNFVYVSTAYVSSHSPGTSIPVEESNSSFEESLISKIGPTQAGDLVKLQPSDLETIERRAMKYFPNNYTYTKLLAETVLDNWVRSPYSPAVSLNIVRPTVICSSLSYPYPGFMESEVALCSIVSMYLRGLLRRFTFPMDHVLDIVPVDTVANTVILAGLLRHNLDSKYVVHIGSTASGGLPVINVFKQAYLVSLREYPYEGGRMQPELPSSFGGLDALQRPLPEDNVPLSERRALQMSKKINQTFDNRFVFFMTNSWKFKDVQLQHLQRAVPSEIQQLFPTSLQSLVEDGTEYLENFSLGALKSVRKK